MMNKKLIPYDIFKYGSGARVFHLAKCKSGVVCEIKETAPEVIEPFVLWDGETKPQKEVSEFLILDPSNELL